MSMPIAYDDCPINAERTIFFQSDKKEKDTYLGPEQRDLKERDSLPDDLQLLLNILDKRMKTGCRNSCPIPLNVQPHITHACGTVMELGEGSFPGGVNQIRDQHKEVKELLTAKKEMTKKIFNTVVIIIITAVLTLLAAGFIDKVRG